MLLVFDPIASPVEGGAVTPEDLQILLFTVGAAALSTALLVVPGVALGWVLAHGRFRGKGVVETVVSLPLVLPPTSVGLLLLWVLAPAHWPGSVLARAGFEVLFTWKAVVLATSVMSAPLLVRSARSALEAVDVRLYRMARTLGHGRFSAFVRVVLPLGGRGVAAGVLLAFCRALGEFGATILIAGNIPGRTQTLALAIFQRVEVGQDEAALRLAWVAVAISFVAVAATERLSRARAAR